MVLIPPKDGAKMEVNVCAKSRAEITTKIQEGIITATIFDSAESQVFILLRDGLFPRFRKSEAFLQMLTCKPVSANAGSSQKRGSSTIHWTHTRKSKTGEEGEL